MSLGNRKAKGWEQKNKFFFVCQQIEHLDYILDEELKIRDIIHCGFRFDRKQ